jgi:hypothetical protein
MNELAVSDPVSIQRSSDRGRDGILIVSAPAQGPVTSLPALHGGQAFCASQA